MEVKENLQVGINNSEACPYFSIVIPMYNREEFIRRALDSCLKQDFVDFEVIVVDDGSTDRSVDVVKRYEDLRIRLICQEVNQERLIARNTGARASKGEWLIWFDSDDELVPYALSTIWKRINEATPDFDGIRFMCRLDSGKTSPAPPLKDEVWNYEGYIRWMESQYDRWSETMPVVRRTTFPKVRFPEDHHYTGEMQYHLDFAKNFKVKACSDVLRCYRLDADNNTWNPNIAHTVVRAPTFANRLMSVLAEHGDALAAWAPSIYGQILDGLATQMFLAGERLNGLKCISRCVAMRPFSLKPWAIMLFGLLGPVPLAYVRAKRAKRNAIAKLNN